MSLASGLAAQATVVFVSGFDPNPEGASLDRESIILQEDMVVSQQLIVCFTEQGVTRRQKRRRSEPNFEWLQAGDRDIFMD